MKIVMSALLALLLAAGAAGAGPIADFEAALASAYADYRAALFRTNQKNKEATEAALSAFEGKWQAVAAKWGKTPPPHLSEDAGWAATLERVAKITATAKEETAKGDLKQAHETLEAIRDEIGAMRHRNNMMTFSDRMNTYHEKMEEVLLRPETAITPEAAKKLHEQAAVLAHLAEDIAKHASASLKDNKAFQEALAALSKSVAAFLAAARTGEPMAIQKAIDGLKGPYSRMFLNFG